MICHRCLLRASRQTTIPSITSRALTHSTRRLASAVTAETTTQTNPRPHDGPPAATSTSAAQPFSTPLSHSPEKVSGLPVADHQRQKKEAPRVASSVPAGTVLKGLNFFKNKQDPLALEDNEYPDWLWGVLAEAEAKKGGEGEAEGDLFAKSKKQRRRAAKALRRQQMLNPEMLQPKIPLYEQSIDLPAGDGTLQGAKEAEASREELTKAMRQNRRAKIKEGNFLKAMG